MPLLRRLSLLRAQWTHHLLCRFSSTYRESYDLQYSLDRTREDLHAVQAQLALAQRDLASSRTQIQSLTLSAQRASEDAARFRDERDLARTQALEAREGAVAPMQALADWLARGQRRESIFGPERAPEVEEGPQGPVGAVRGRAMVQEGTRREWAADRSAQVDLQEIMVRQRAARAGLQRVEEPEEA